MPNRFSLRQVVTFLALIFLVAWAIARDVLPPAPVPATAPDTVFSAERAMKHVAAIAQRPHALGMADHDRVRDYIVTQLTALGVKPQLQRTTGIGTRYAEAGQVQNIVADLPGGAPNGESVLLVAHYDGVEAGPAASDDGAGVAAILETLRALKARNRPLAHDVVLLFTDGEEPGLLGSAAFVREHPWARGVAFALNFEARGTTGRSYMFETGPGNLDAVRALRTAGDVTAGSVFTTVYRALPNDTDLSELARLGIPALNFAFAGGVERYHTAHDDYAELNPGSLQHHGAQMLAITQTLAAENLPRPKTGDAVFFGLPILGLVIYPVWLAIPLMVIALVLTIVVLRPVWRAALIGGTAMVVIIAVLALIARSIQLTGPARWSGIYAAAIALFVIGVNVEAFRVVKRWKADAHAGALVVWMLLVLGTSIWIPGVSYLFVWPLLFALVAVRSLHPVARWAAAVVTILMLAGFTYLVAVVMLGLAGMGAIALVVLTSLMTWLLVPTIEQGMVPVRGASALHFAVPAVILGVLGLVLVKPTAAHPIPSALTYLEDADSTGAWFGTFLRPDDWTRSVIGVTAPVPAWVAYATEFGQRFFGHAVERVPLDAPTATLVGDTTVDGVRRLAIRIHAAAGTTGIIMHAAGARVLAATVDGRPIDTTAYRYHVTPWTMQYWAIPDRGAVIGLAIVAGAHVDFDLAARRPGLPQIPGLVIPARPDDVVPAGEGDATIVYRRRRF